MPPDGHRGSIAIQEGVASCEQLPLDVCFPPKDGVIGPAQLVDS
jgi:hypothetical protein